MSSPNLERAWKSLDAEQSKHRKKFSKKAPKKQRGARRKLTAGAPSPVTATAAGIQALLTKIGCYEGALDGNLRSPTSLRAIQWFQSDNGLTADGVIGNITGGKLAEYESLLAQAPPEMKACRRWRLTHYMIADQAGFAGPQPIEVYDADGNVLAKVEPGFFAQMSLQGTGKLRDGRLLNVTGKTTKVDSKMYSGVLEVARRSGFLPNRPGYAGIVIVPEGNDYRVVSALTYQEVKNKGSEGFGVQNGLSLEAGKTLAADLGRYRGSSEPRFVGKGGLVPVGTKVWILGLGWFTVNDTGGGIFGAHFDIFAGTPAQAKTLKHPSMGYVWYDGVEAKIPYTYSYGHMQRT